jgi:hypothetical protein
MRTKKNGVVDRRLATGRVLRGNLENHVGDTSIELEDIMAHDREPVYAVSTCHFSVLGDWTCMFDAGGHGRRRHQHDGTLRAPALERKHKGKQLRHPPLPAFQDLDDRRLRAILVIRTP